MGRHVLNQWKGESHVIDWINNLFFLLSWGERKTCMPLTSPGIVGKQVASNLSPSNPTKKIWLNAWHVMCVYSVITMIPRWGLPAAFLEDLKTVVLAWRRRFFPTYIEEWRCEEPKYLTCWRMKFVNWGQLPHLLKMKIAFVKLLKTEDLKTSLKNVNKMKTMSCAGSPKVLHG